MNDSYRVEMAVIYSVLRSPIQPSYFWLVAGRSLAPAYLAWLI